MAYQSELEKREKEYLENPDRFAPYAEATRKAGNLDLAIEVVQAGLAKKPNYLSGHIILGRCYIDKKNDAEAHKVFEHVLELDAENIIALRFLAEITERSGDVSSAQRWLKRLVDVDPSNEEAAESLKRLEEAAPAPPPPAPEPAAPAEPAATTVSGFEATSFEEPAAVAPPAEPVSAPDDFRIEQAASPFETPSGAPTAVGGMDQFGMEPTELSLGDTPPAVGGMLDLQPVESETVFTESVPAQSAMPEAPASADPPLLVFEDAPAAPPPEPEPEPIAALSLDPEPAAPARTSLTDLPLIMPDDLEPAPPPPPRRSVAATPPPPPAPAAVPAIEEPEPVITETMAEVYARQGLIAEARDVYRKLIEARPNDAGLRQRLAELERQRVSPPKGVPAVPAAAPAKPRFAAAAPGGQSARSLFGKVLASKPGAPAGPAAPPAPPTPPPAAAPMTTMDAAFAEETAAPGGAPTRPTSDELSLASVFGEESTAPPQAPPPPPAAPAAAPAAGTPGFSFDEFFGAKKDAAPAPAAESAPADTEAKSPDDFVSWLKGLKS